MLPSCQFPISSVSIFSLQKCNIFGFSLKMWSTRRPFILNGRKAVYEAREPEMSFFLCHLLIHKKWW